MKRITKILIVDDHPILRQGLRGMLDGEQGLSVTGEAGNGNEAIQLAASLNPDVIIMDINLPGMSGIEATRKILAEDPGKKILVLSLEADRRFIVEVLESGAKGYVVKESFFDELVSAIRIVAAGDTYLGPKITELIIKDYLMRTPEGKQFSPSILTHRERETVQYLADGKNSKEIAIIFGVSVKTVDVHRHNIMKKLNLYSIAELTKYAIREGLTSI